MGSSPWKRVPLTMEDQDTRDQFEARITALYLKLSATNDESAKRKKTIRNMEAYISALEKFIVDSENAQGEASFLNKLKRLIPGGGNS